MAKKKRFNLCLSLSGNVLNFILGMRPSLDPGCPSQQSNLITMKTECGIAKAEKLKFKSSTNIDSKFHRAHRTVHGATYMGPYGMQKAMALRHQCLVVVTHETYSPLLRAPYGMQNVISTVRAKQRGAPSSTSKHALVANPCSRATPPEKCHSSSQIKRQKTFRKYCDCHEIYKTQQTRKRKTQWSDANKHAKKTIPADSLCNVKFSHQKIRECTQQQTNCAHAKHPRGKNLDGKTYKF